MKRKPSNPLRPKRRGCPSNECAAEPATVNSDPPNSESAPESLSQVRHLAMSHHSQNLLKFLNEDRARQRFCDVSVSVGGKLYSAHKVVLAHGSSYFHAELSKNPATAHVTLDHVDDSVFKHLLGFLYTSECVVTETDLPALTEAARFLDMMDILKLLCEEGINNPVHVIQVQDESRESPKLEMTSDDPQTVDAAPQSPSDTQRSKGNCQVSNENPKQIHLAESHTDVQQETSVQKEKKTATTRRSTRRRRTPTKYQRNSVECSVRAPEDKQVAGPPREQDEEMVEETGKEVLENQAPQPNVKETSKPPQEEDVMDEEEEDGDANEAVLVQGKGAEVCMTDKQQGSEKRTDRQSVPEVKVRVPAAGSSTQSLVYPEGLAPVIIQTSNKKTLKCPKCDKTFDRAGGHQYCYILSSCFRIGTSSRN